MEGFKRTLGAEHRDTLTSMNNLALTWKDQGRDEEARKLMEDCVRLQHKSLGADDDRTISSARVLTSWKKDIGIIASKPAESKESLN
jgi:hypothetical protein